MNNFLEWSGATIPQALKAVTITPAAMLGVQGIKGSLDSGADADLVIFSEVEKIVRDESGEREIATTKLVIDEVWKFGTKVFSRTNEEGEGLL